MADDRTPHPTSLTESAPDDDVRHDRKRARRPEDGRRRLDLDHEAVVASEREVSEHRAKEGPGSRLA